MKPIFSIFLLCVWLLPCSALGQENEPISPFDGRHWGVVVEHPDTEKVSTRSNLQYATLGRPLRCDVYLPLLHGGSEKFKTVVILNGIGDQPGQPTMKDSPAQTSWARLLAAHGFVAVTMESETNKIQESIAGLFQYLSEQSDKLNIDTARMSVQAFSANCRESLQFIMGSGVSKNVKAAVMYYGESPALPLREDLPVFFVVAEKDIRNNNYGNLWSNVLKNKSPWTITIARDMPHAFDLFSDTETSQRVIMSTLSFLKDHLDNVPARATPFSAEREIVAATYDTDQTRKVRLMRDWMRDHPESNDSYAFSAYGAALLDSRNFAEAEKYLGKAIALEPANKGNYLMMAVAAYALGKNADGDQNLAMYERDSTPEAFTYFYIADRLRGIKKFSQAIELYERALTFPIPVPSFITTWVRVMRRLATLTKRFKI